jgi:hypothetical protein
VLNRIVVVVLSLVLGLAVITPARAGDADAGQDYFLSNSLLGGTADEVFVYGRAGDQVLVGDWDGDAADTLAVRRGASYFLSNDFDGGDADTVFDYGRSNDEVFVGDWDGDGKDTLAVRRGTTFYVMNRLGGGNAESVFEYGRLGDVVLVGDWDGDGRDSFAVRRGRTYYISNELRGGQADDEFVYGRAGDLVYVGDWDGNSTDTLGVRRGRTYYLSNALQGGKADSEFVYGRSADVTLIGDWDADGGDTLGVRRNAKPATAPDPEPEAKAQPVASSRCRDRGSAPTGDVQLGLEVLTRTENGGYYGAHRWRQTSVDIKVTGSDVTPEALAMVDDVAAWLTFNTGIDFSRGGGDDIVLDLRAGNPPRWFTTSFGDTIVRARATVDPTNSHVCRWMYEEIGQTTGPGGDYGPAGAVFAEEQSAEGPSAFDTWVLRALYSAPSTDDAALKARLKATR